MCCASIDEATNADQTKFVLDENEIPKKWYNIAADIPAHLDPMLHPANQEPTDLPPPLFPKELMKEEKSNERWIPIPEEVRDVYRLWRPTPMYRAVRLEKALKTPPRSITSGKV